MKLFPDKPATKKTMRVATVLTGVTACAAAFAPMAAAAPAAGHGKTATPPPGKAIRVRVPGVSALRMEPKGTVRHDVEPYSMSLIVEPSIASFHVCGYHTPNGAWRCTPTYSNLFYHTIPRKYSKIGGNIRSWNRGTIDVYWNNGGRGSWNTCNTNINVYSSSANGRKVTLIAGFGIPNCGQ
jgi:hypothetical protein